MSIHENIVHKGSVLASSIAFETATPFVYTGPGPLYGNGMPFFSQSTGYGTPFLTTDMLKSVFTFTVGGSYMIQMLVGLHSCGFVVLAVLVHNERLRDIYLVVHICFRKTNNDK